jgi:hypothetical protein
MVTMMAMGTNRMNILFSSVLVTEPQPHISFHENFRDLKCHKMIALLNHSTGMNKDLAGNSISMYGAATMNNSNSARSLNIMFLCPIGQWF